MATSKIPVAKLDFYQGQAEINYTGSIAPQAEFHTNLKTAIDAVLPAGYKCIAITGFTTGYAGLVVRTIGYYESNWSITVLNVGSTTATPAGNAHIVVWFLAVPE